MTLRLAADRPPAPLPVRQALRTLELGVRDYIDQARVAASRVASTVNALARAGPGPDAATRADGAGY